VAVSATFIADYTSFNSAVEKAVLKLKDFQSGAAGVEKALSRVGDSFSGRKVLQEATLAVKAVTDLGGTAKLTSAEQARLNTTVTEAIAKYKALGLQAPADMQRIAKETKQTESVMDAIKAKLGGLGPVIASAFSVAAVVAAGKKVIDYANNLENLSARTQISTTGLQKLEAAFRGTDVTLDTVAQNVDKLSKNLVGGDKGAVAAMQKLGLNVQQLKTLAPDRLFLSVADAVGNIQNPTERAFAAMTIFGKGGVELLQGLTGHLRETADAAAGVIPDETLRQADAFGDKLEGLQKEGLALMSQVLVPLLPGLTQLAEWFAKLASGAISLAQSLENALIAKFLQGEAAILHWAASLADVSQRIPVLGKYIGASADTVAALNERARVADDTMKAFGITVKAAGDAAKNTTPHMIGIGEAVKAAAGAADEAAKKEAQLFRAQMENNQKFWEMVDNLEKQMLDVRRNIEAKFYADQEKMAFEAGKRLIDTTLQINQSIIGLDAERMRQLLTQNVPQATEATMKAQGVKAGKSFMSSLIDGVKGNLSGLNDVFQRAFEGGGGVMGAVKSLSTNILSNLLTIIPGVGPILAQFSGAIVAGLSKIGSAIKGLFGGPSGKEKEGRSATDVFTAGLAAALTQVEQLEVHSLVAAGNSEKWATQVVAIRDAYLKAGHSVDEALDLVNRLFAAEKQGTSAVQAVIDDFTKTSHDALPYMEGKVRDLTDEWKNLAAAGTPEIIALEQVKAGYLDIAEQAVKAGQGIPEALKPVLLALAKAGELTDDDARALLGLGKDTTPTFKEMEEAANRYGIKLDELGPKIAALRDKDTADQLVKDFQKLVEQGGAPVREVLAGMSDDLNAIIKDAQKFGIAVPAELQPLLEKAAGLGYLVDENGNKLTDLSNLKWAPPIEDATKRLIDQLGGPDGLQTQVDKLHTMLDDLPDIDRTITYHYRTEGSAPSGSNTDENVPGFKTGTKGKFLDFGRGTTVQLHGRERVVTEAEGRSDDAKLSDLHAALQDIRHLLKNQPLMLKSAIHAAGM
jgi:hypothetical protein